MASVNGEVLEDGYNMYSSTNSFNIMASGYIPMDGTLNGSNTRFGTYYGTSLYSIVATGYAAFNYPGGGGTFTSYTIHYHKRAYSVTLSQYVEWDTTYADGAYPGGGTINPSNGIILYSWVTSP